MGAQVGLTQLDPTNQRFGEAVSGSWSYQKLPKNHPTKYIYIYICIKWMISLSLSLKTSVTQFYFLLKERQRELKKKKLFEEKWKVFVLWNEVVPVLTMVPFTTLGENLNGETIYYWIRDFSKGNPKIINMIINIGIRACFSFVSYSLLICFQKEDSFMFWLVFRKNSVIVNKIKKIKNGGCSE